MSTTTQRKSIALPTGDLLTARAINNVAYELREEFTELGIEFPAPFIVWQHGLNDGDAKRLQKLLCADGTKADVDLIPKIDRTLRSMQKGTLKIAA